jgi:hypothetical protein
LAIGHRAEEKKGTKTLSSTTICIFRAYVQTSLNSNIFAIFPKMQTIPFHEGQ